MTNIEAVLIVASSFKIPAPNTKDLAVGPKISTPTTITFPPLERIPYIYYFFRF